MPPTRRQWQRSLQAADSAGRLLDELGVDPARQVDVFSMCEDLGLWLSFMPLDGLLGAFVPEGVGGVLITDQRPITVQRYTAAHELGHWRLEHGHGLALDGDEHVFGATPLERERLAQVFAASLLMPPPLILSLLTRIGADHHEDVGAMEAYFVAREAGVSYEASVRQLANLEIITPAEATTLLQVRPLTIKSDLAGGRRPVHGYADVWPVDESWNDMLLTLRVDDEVVVSLPENRSTGYRWMFEDDVVKAVPTPEPPPLTDRTGVAPADIGRFLRAARAAEPGGAPGAALDRARHVRGTTAADVASERALPGRVATAGDAYVLGRGPMLPPGDARRIRLSIATGGSSLVASGQPEATNRKVKSDETDPLIGATGRRLLGFRFLEAGPKTIRLYHRSPYSAAPPVEDYVLHAIVEPHRHGFAIDQLISEPQAAWVSHVRDRKLREPIDTINDPECG